MRRPSSSSLERLAAALERLAPPPPPKPDFAARRGVRVAGLARGVPRRCRTSTASRSALLKGIDRAAEQLLDNTRRFAKGLPANNALLWGARGMGKSSLVKAAHAEVRARARPGRQGQAGPQAGRDPSRGHRLAARLPRAPARRRRPLHRLLRRPLLRQGRHLLQVAEGGAGGRHRGPAGERRVLRHLQPPPPDAARHDGERALDRHQPVRGGRGEGVAVRPLRPLARLPQRHAGRIPRDGAQLRRPPQARRSRTPSWCARRSNGR